ncbi:hypothetical protein BDV18DRAFT_145104 [Aspergillus unguis]
MDSKMDTKMNSMDTMDTMTMDQPPQYSKEDPTQQFQSHQPSRGLEVTFTSCSGRHLKVTENTSDGPIVYSADLKSRKPHMIFQSNGTAHLPATVKFHNFSRAIDVSIHGEEMPMAAKCWTFKHEYSFTSHAVSGKSFFWRKASWRYLHLQCVDESGTVFATFRSHKSWSGKKAGRLEIMPAAAEGGQGLVDELVVTGLADVYYQMMQAMAASGTSAASASSAAAVSVTV